MMKLSKEQVQEFEKAAEPLMKWLSENCHPRVSAIVEPSRAELFEETSAINNDKFIKD
jgi:hypothetical protein